MFRRRLIVAGALGVLLTGCGGGSNNSSSDSPSTVVSYQWSESTLTAVSKASLGPPMTARAIGMLTTAVYDAWAAYDAKAVGTRLGGTLRRPAGERTDANKREAISFAAYRVLADLYPAQIADFQAKMTQLGYDYTDTSEDTTTPRGIGNQVARVLLEFRHADGSNQLNNYADTTGYVPVNTPTTVTDPSKWQQLQFANGNTPAYVGPHWGNVTPFALTSGSQFRGTGPKTYGSPEHRAEVAQELSDATQLDDRKKTIAVYWADGPKSVLPPGHWLLLAQYVANRDKMSLDQQVKLFFCVGNAVMDAGIACWESKRFFNSSRPITQIRNLYAGQTIRSFGVNGWVDVDGSQWAPYQSPNFVTPPFPEYPSGHSTFSSAAAQVLRRFTGSDSFGMSTTLPAGFSGLESNTPAAPVTLSWPTFTDAANEAGISRLYGGIHLSSGNTEGQRMGTLVGEQVWNRCRTLFDGSAVTP